MSEKVKTPLGEVTVLTVEELVAQMRHREQKYIRRVDDSYECPKCGSTILAATVVHPCWDGPFAMSGSGKCVHEGRPYCLRCEERPSDRGCPVAPKGSYHNP